MPSAARGGRLCARARLPPPVVPASDTAGAGAGGGHAPVSRDCAATVGVRPPRACASAAGAEIQIWGAVGVVVSPLSGRLREREQQQQQRWTRSLRWGHGAGRPPSGELWRGRAWGLIRGGGALLGAGAAGTEGSYGWSGAAGERLLVAGLWGRNSFSQPWLLARACQRLSSPLTFLRGVVGL